MASRNMDDISDDGSGESVGREDSDEASPQAAVNGEQNSTGDLVQQAYGFKLSTGIFSRWERKYFMLYPNRIEWGDSAQTMNKGRSLVFFAPPLLVEKRVMKESTVIRMQHIGEKKDYIIKFESDPESEEWLANILDNIHTSNSLLLEGPRMLNDTSSTPSISVARRRNAPSSTEGSDDL